MYMIQTYLIIQVVSGVGAPFAWNEGRQMQANLFEAVADWLLAVIAVFRGPGHCRRDSPAHLIMEPLFLLLDAVARQREQHQAGHAAFMAARGAQDIGDLSQEESRELFAILLAQVRLDAEMRALRRLIGRLSDAYR